MSERDEFGVIFGGGVNLWFDTAHSPKIGEFDRYSQKGLAPLDLVTAQAELHSPYTLRVVVS